VATAYENELGGGNTNTSGGRVSATEIIRAAPSGGNAILISSPGRSASFLISDTSPKMKSVIELTSFPLRMAISECAISWKSAEPKNRRLAVTPIKKWAAGGSPGKLAANVPAIENVINAKITNHMKWTAILTPKIEPSRNVLVAVCHSIGFKRLLVNPSVQGVCLGKKRV